MKLPTPITFNKTKYIYLSAQQSHEMIFELARKIDDEIKSGKLKKPDYIVGIARGALPWIKTLADWLSVPSISTLRISHYTGVYKRLKKPTIVHSHLPNLKNKRVLIFDNTVETGKTLQLAKAHLAQFGAEELETAVFFHKPTSKLIPNYYLNKTSAWIIFYFDIMESVKTLSSTWINEGLDLIMT